MSNTRLEVSRGPRGLVVHLPSGRTLNVRADESGVRFIERMLRDADERAHYERKRSGYIGDFPTQHVIDIWEREERNKRAIDAQLAEINYNKKLAAEAALKAKWAARGIDLDKLEIDI